MTDISTTHLTSGAASPFLPGTKIQFAWDSTSIGWFKTCPRLYQYSMIEGWAPKGESVHLRFGIEFHSALEAYEHSRANGIRHEDAIHDTIRAVIERTAGWEVDRDTKAGKYKNRDSLISLVVDYLDHFVDDPCETYIRADGVPAVELSFRFDLDWGPSPSSRCASMKSSDGSGSAQIPCDGILGSGGELIGGCGEPCEFVMHPEAGENVHQPYVLCGHLDRVVEFNGHLFAMDHKTTTTTPGQYYFAQYEPNNQMSLYTLAGGVVLATPIKGVIIRAAQILLDSPNRFISGFTYRTPDQTNEWLLDLRLHLNNAEACAEADYWPMNDTACDKFGGCKFRGICSKDPAVRDKFLAADFIKQSEEERWNPLRNRGGEK